MCKYLVIVSALLISTCTAEIEDAPTDSGAEETAGAPAPIDLDTFTDEDLLEEERLIATTTETEARIRSGLPLEGEEDFNDKSAYQLRLGGSDSGVLLGRMTVSEGTSLMPLRANWKADMHGILQVVTENQRSDEPMYAALARHSPHVARIEKYTRLRQRWTSTLPAEGVEAPEYWVECTEWYTDKRDRKKGLPKGCNGVWLNGADNWETVRDYAKKLIRKGAFLDVVQGVPKTWGGRMDIARFLERNPGMCWLESENTLNYFFGDRSDPRNACKSVPKELIEESKVISAHIIRRDLRRKSDRNRKAAR